MRCMNTTRVNSITVAVLTSGANETNQQINGSLTSAFGNADAIGMNKTRMNHSETCTRDEIITKPWSYYWGEQ